VSARAGASNSAGDLTFDFIGRDPQRETP
jgi:hypothetical protein